MWQEQLAVRSWVRVEGGYVDTSYVHQDVLCVARGFVVVVLWGFVQLGRRLFMDSEVLTDGGDAEENVGAKGRHR